MITVLVPAFNEEKLIRDCLESLIAQQPQPDEILVVDNNSTDATADGYWIFLKPLPRGVYTIRFEGSCEFGRLNSGAVYEIEID